MYFVLYPIGASLALHSDAGRVHSSYERVARAPGCRPSTWSHYLQAPHLVYASLVLTKPVSEHISLLLKIKPWHLFNLVFPGYFQ